MALLAAKARALEGRPAEDAGKLVAYCSDQVLCSPSHQVSFAHFQVRLPLCLFKHN